MIRERVEIPKNWKAKLLGLDRGLFSRASSRSGNLVGFGLFLGGSAWNNNGGLVSWFVHVYLGVAGDEQKHRCCKKREEDIFHNISQLVKRALGFLLAKPPSPLSYQLVRSDPACGCKE